MIHLLKYLRSPDYLEYDQDEFGCKIRKAKIATLATLLLERLYPRSSPAQPQKDAVDVKATSGIDDGQSDSQATKMSLSEGFAFFLENEERSETSSLEETQTARSQVVKREMSLFDAT